MSYAKITILKVRLKLNAIGIFPIFNIKIQLNPPPSKNSILFLSTTFSFLQEPKVFREPGCHSSKLPPAMIWLINGRADLCIDSFKKGKPPKWKHSFLSSKKNHPCRCRGIFNCIVAFPSLHCLFHLADPTCLKSKIQSLHCIVWFIDYCFINQLGFRGCTSFYTLLCSIVLIALLCIS